MKAFTVWISIWLASCSLEELGDGDVVDVHELGDGDVIVAGGGRVEELCDRNIIQLLLLGLQEEFRDGCIVEEEVVEGASEELSHGDVVEFEEFGC